MSVIRIPISGGGGGGGGGPKQEKKTLARLWGG